MEILAKQFVHQLLYSGAAKMEQVPCVVECKARHNFRPGQATYSGFLLEQETVIISRSLQMPESAETGQTASQHYYCPFLGMRYHR